MFCNRNTLPVEVIALGAKMGYDLTGGDAQNELERLMRSSLNEKMQNRYELQKTDERYHNVRLQKQEEINSAIEAKQLAEHNLKLSKQKLLVLEKKEEKTQEYIDRIHELELKNAALLRENNLKDEVIKRSDKENEQLNKRIDKLIDLKVTPQQVKVIKGSNSDVKIIK